MNIIKTSCMLALCSFVLNVEAQDAETQIELAKNIYDDLSINPVMSIGYQFGKSTIDTANLYASNTKSTMDSNIMNFAIDTYMIGFEQPLFIGLGYGSFSGELNNEPVTSNPIFVRVGIGFKWLRGYFEQGAGTLDGPYGKTDSNYEGYGLDFCYEFVCASYHNLKFSPNEGVISGRYRDEVGANTIGISLKVPLSIQ